MNCMTRYMISPSRRVAHHDSHIVHKHPHQIVEWVGPRSQLSPFATLAQQFPGIYKLHFQLVQQLWALWSGSVQVTPTNVEIKCGAGACAAGPRQDQRKQTKSNESNAASRASRSRRIGTAGNRICEGNSQSKPESGADPAAPVWLCATNLVRSPVRRGHLRQVNLERLMRIRNTVLSACMSRFTRRRRSCSARGE